MSKVTTLLAAIAVLFCFAPNASADLDNLDIGGDVTVMGVYTENTLDLNSDRKGVDDQDDFLRVEGHLWFQADLSDNVTAKISVEADRDFESADTSDLDIFLEEAWVQMAYIYESGISMKLGRQYIELGDGFVFGDAGSYSTNVLNTLGEWEVAPFDAVNVWYDGDDWMLNFIYAKVNEVRELDAASGRGDIDAYALYFSYTGLEDYVFDLYGMMVDMNGRTRLPYGMVYDARINSATTGDAQSRYDDITVYAIGARVAGSFAEGWKFKVEGVYEFGDANLSNSTDEADIKAWAIEAGLNYTFDSEYQPMVGLTYVYMSGDDDDDDDYETYIRLFENRVYGEIFESYAALSNLHIFNLYGGFNLSEDIAVSMKYYYFMADEDLQIGKYEYDDDLGHEFDAYVDYKFTEEVSAMFAAGLFIPGDAVEDVFGADDNAWFARAGVKVEF